MGHYMRSLGNTGVLGRAQEVRRGRLAACVLANNPSNRLSKGLHCRPTRQLAAALNNWCRRRCSCCSWPHIPGLISTW